MCTSMMQDTFRGIAHSFMDHFKITNTNHPSTAILLRRIATFYYVGLVKLPMGGEDLGGEFCCCSYSGATPSLLLLEPEMHHLPNPGTVNGAIDLISLCFLVIFGNVLDFRTYCTPDGGPAKEADKNDVNNISIDERYNICIARGTCIELLNWWRTKYSISTPEFSCQNDFPTHFIISQALALWVYKTRTEQDGRPGAPGCTAELLLAQIFNVLGCLKIPIKSTIFKIATTGHLAESKLGYSRESLDRMTVTCFDPPQKYGNHHYF